jgi:hypothetical protein
MGRFRRSPSFVAVVGLALAPAAPGSAQTIVRDVERLAADRPEAWAMNYVSASTIATGFGAAPDLRAGQWRLDADLGHIPRLDARQQRVGFGGEKAEDLNKSPVFGRVRGTIGLGAAWVAELGYTPPLRVDGSRARDLVTLAIGRRLLDRDAWSVSARIFGQHGAAEGDITCPAQVAGPFDPERNPFGCVEASRDRIALNHYGFDATFAAVRADWSWHATLGAVRNEPTVQVDARVFTVRDRSYLIARGVLPFLALGANRGLGDRWQFGFELLHVPLQVRRPESDRVRDDPFTALRLRFGWQPR